MAKKERKFYNELDFLRHQVRELAAETGTVIKDTNFMKKEECKVRIKELYKRELKKEVDQETKETIEKLKKELADRNNQITELQREKVELENAKKDYLKEIIAKTELIKTREKEIKGLQESNKYMEETIEAGNKIIAANIEKLEELEKEIKEKNAEIRESQLTLEKKEKELERCKNHNIKLIEKIDSLTIEITELKNRKWYHSLFNFFKI